MPNDLQNLYDIDAGDEVPSNHSPNPTFRDIAEARLGRRGMLMGGIATAVFGFIGAGSRPVAAQGAAQAATAAGPVIGSKPVPLSVADTVVVPEGYSAQVLIPHGTPLNGQPATKSVLEMTAAEQEQAIGTHHDGMHFFPIEGREPDQGSSTDGLIAINHEYIEPRFLHARAAGQSIGNGRMPVVDGQRDAEEVRKEVDAVHAHSQR
jgi:secreted PhoX family phosphatase